MQPISTISSRNTTRRLLQRGLLLLFALSGLEASAARFEAQRINNGEPIISQALFEAAGAPTEEGKNINGPSVIRIPDWIPAGARAAPEALFYLYFAHHQGDYIRMAWASELTGPWHLYRTGREAAEGQRGVLDMGKDRVIPLPGNYIIDGHIASPEVQIDEKQRRIVMYFHGKVLRDGTSRRKQSSFVATSADGLDFNAGIRPLPLGLSYLRVFEHDGILAGLTRDTYYQALSSASPWVVPEDLDAQASVLSDDMLWQNDSAQFLDFSRYYPAIGGKKKKHQPHVRHMALYQQTNSLYVFFTMIGHAPERILVTHVDLAAARWWGLTPQAEPRELLRPELPWEGAMVGPVPSKKGPAWEIANALRDPYVFSYQGSLYLFYAGGGESAIGLARLTYVED